MRFIVRLGTYVLMGPPIGAIFYVLGAVLYGATESSSSNGNALVPAFAVIFATCLLSMFAMVGSYMIGGIAALVGGVIVALVGPLIPYRPVRPVFAGVVGALSTHFLWVPLGPMTWGEMEAVLITIIGGLSAVICSIRVEFAESRNGRSPA
jgi:hypothetical protein